MNKTLLLVAMGNIREWLIRYIEVNDRLPESIPLDVQGIWSEAYAKEGLKEFYKEQSKPRDIDKGEKLKWMELTEAERKEICRKSVEWLEGKRAAEKVAEVQD